MMHRLRLTLPECVAHWAKYYPNKPAVITTTAESSFKELDESANQIAEMLHTRHNDFGFGVGLLLDNNFRFLAGLIGVLRSGNYVVMLHPQAPSATLNAQIEDGECRALLVDRVDQRNELQVTHPDLINFPEHRASHAEAVRVDRSNMRSLDAIWGIIYSSGTTGRPKGIVRNDASILTELLGWCLELPISRSSNVYIARPLFYTGGLVLSSATLLVGGTVIAPEVHSPETYWNACARLPLDVAFFIPDQIPGLIASVSNRVDTSARSKTILTMGGPISATAKREIVQILGSAYVESWGNSEGLGTITDASDVEQRPNSIGRPFMTDIMYVLDDFGAELGPGEVGRIAGVADSRLSEYKNREDLNKTLIRGELVISEDLGYVDESGFFYLVGRVTGRFLRNGVPVYCAEIEAVLRRMPGISAVCVVGIEDQSDGHVPVAAIQADNAGSLDAHRILTAANELLPDHQRLRMVAIVPEFERNAGGKIRIDTVTAFFQGILTQEDAPPSTVAIARHG